MNKISIKTKVKYFYIGTNGHGCLLRAGIALRPLWAQCMSTSLCTRMCGLKFFMAEAGVCSIIFEVSFLAAPFTEISFSECLYQPTLLWQCVVASGVAMAQNATRRPPHCFNLLRQVRILQKAGMGSAETQMKDSCNLVRF